MGANDKVAATLHPDPEPTPVHPCRDCGAIWTSKSAADECEILDAAEARQARRERH
jgi:hypothetical protein